MHPLYALNNTTHSKEKAGLVDVYTIMQQHAEGDHLEKFESQWNLGKQSCIYSPIFIKTSSVMINPPDTVNYGTHHNASLQRIP